MTERAKTYAEFWDRYVRDVFPEIRKATDPDATHLLWPGDEWGTPDIWSKIFEIAFAPALPERLERAIEIGPGSGKYTEMVLNRCPAARILAFDVSSIYLDVLRARCAEAIAAGRVEPLLLDQSPDGLARATEARGWGGTVDFAFSIDAMVHVDLQYLVAYWIALHRVLRPGGTMLMSVADATSPLGYRKLIDDIPTYFAAQGEVTSKFEWLSPALVEDLLGRIGFDVRFIPKLSGRDCWFVATRRGDGTGDAPQPSSQDDRSRPR